MITFWVNWNSSFKTSLIFLIVNFTLHMQFTAYFSGKLCIYLWSYIAYWYSFSWRILMAVLSISVSDSSLYVSVWKYQHFSMFLSFSSGHLSILKIISHSCYKITFEWYSGFGWCNVYFLWCDVYISMNCFRMLIIIYCIYSLLSIKYIML